MLGHMMRDWSLSYFRHKDIIARKIQKFDEADSSFSIEYSDKRLEVRMAPDLQSADLREYDKAKHLVIVTVNAEEVVPWLERKWQDLITLPHLSFLMINPFSKGDTKWQICPAVHHRIADESALKTGLLAMGELVDKIPLAEFEAKMRENNINSRR